MSVATQNKFALLNEDGESVATALPAKAAGATVVVEPKPAPRTNNRGRAAQPNAQSRSGRYYKRGGAPTTDATADADGNNNPSATGERFDRTEGRPDRGRGRGRGRGGRGGGAGGGGDRPPRGRIYDKDSQTGKIDTEKAITQGWGGNTGVAELGAELQGAADALADGAADTSGWGAPAADTSGWDAPAADASAWDAPAPADGAEKEGAVATAEGDARRKRREEEEEEDNTLTLDEYLAKKKAEEQSAIPKLEGTRTVGEGSEWKDAVQLLREENEEVYYAGKSKAAPKQKAKKDEKVYIAIDLPPQQRDSRGRGGPRGGRGGERGGRGRGGDRGGRGGGGRGRGGESWGSNGPVGRRPAQANVDVDDQSAFPSLS